LNVSRAIKVLRATSAEPHERRRATSSDATVRPGRSDKPERRNWQHEDWVRALGEHFFPEDAKGHPVIFLVDDETLASIHPSGVAKTAVDSLTEVVRRRLTPGRPNGVFDGIYREASKWRYGTDTADFPPSLPLLAVCVLAASRMGTGGFTAANYRGPFGTSLGLSTERIPPGYESCVPPLWRQLEWWLEERQRGARGRSTIAVTDHRSNIGYAVSQTLFSGSDEGRLADFFRSIELQPGEQISGAELLAYFRVWAPKRGLSAGAHRMLEEPEFAGVLDRILSAHAERWDETRIPGTNQRQGRVLVRVRAFPRPTINLMAPQPDGFPARFPVRSPRGAVEMVATQKGWYDAVPIEASDHVLMDGATLEGVEFSLRLHGGRLHVLRINAEAGGWTSVDTLRPGERHWILVHESLWKDVQQFLERKAGADCQEDERIRATFPQWHLLRDVVIDSSYEGDLPSELRVLLPTIRNRLSLEGGLPIRGSDSYLVGGEPDLWRPIDLVGQGMAACVESPNGTRELPGSEALVRLSELEPRLPAGEHRIIVPGAFARTFRTVPSALEHPREVPEVGHRLDLDDRGRVVAYWPPETVNAGEDLPDAVIRGAAIQGGRVPEVGPRPVLVHRAATYGVMLGARPGHRQGTHAPPPAPRWMQDRGMSDLLYDVVPAFEAVWLITTWGAERTRRAHLVNDVPPAEPLEDEEAVAAWAEEFLAEAVVRSEDRLRWDQYVARAREVTDEG